VTSHLPPLRGWQSFLVFLGSVIIVFGFFATGAFIGRRAAPRGETAPAAPAQRSSTEWFLVEVAVVETRDRADAIVSQLRRQYTSASAEQDASDRHYHVYVGPYNNREAADTVVAELTEQGAPSVTIKPFRR
jgi:cell division septation protein DedD